MGNGRGSRWLRTGVGLLATLILAGCSSSDEPATDATNPVSESPSDDPGLGEMTFTYTPDLCEQLDWSGVEMYAPFEQYGDESADEPDVAGTGSHLCSRTFGDDLSGYRVHLEVRVSDSAVSAREGYEANRDRFAVPLPAGEVIEVDGGWDISYLWVDGPGGVFFGQDDNFDVVFDVMLPVDDPQAISQEELVELVMDIVEEARELSRA